MLVLARAEKPKRRKSAGMRQSAVALLKWLLLEIAPWCARCGRTLQGTTREADDFARMFREQLHCPRCRKQMLQRGKPRLCFSADAVRWDGTLPTTPENAPEPVHAACTVVGLEIPADLWEVFVARCRKTGVDPSRLASACILNHVLNALPERFGSKLSMLENWERGSRRVQKWPDEAPVMG